jgi:thiol-disulfide isomerase/thioredoxin
MQNQRKTLIALVALAAAGLAFWAIFATISSSDPPARPIRAEGMANFTPAAPPEPAPAGYLVTMDRKETSLAVYRGKIVLLNFWATWCAPCVREMPSLLRLHRAMGGDDFTVLAVSEDLKGWRAIAPFLERLNLGGLPVLHDPQGAFARAFGVTGLPATILIGPTGLILGRMTGPAEWDSDAAKALIRDFMARRPGR